MRSRRLVLLVLLFLASVDVLGRKKAKRHRRKWPRKFPKPYSWMHYSSNYDPTIEENGCVDIRPQCVKWAQFPGYCVYSRGYMLKHCRRSCRLCKLEDEVAIGKTSGVGNSNGICEDRLEDCQTYVKTQSQCNLFSGLMKRYCARTCGFCCYDQLTDCSLFIRNPSQCRGLNGFFKRYCPQTCQMCGSHLPIKKPGCQDELDDCKSFTLEHCQIHKQLGSKYCAKTCGFCEERGHSSVGTTQPSVHQQFTHGPTSSKVTGEYSVTTSKVTKGVTEMAFQDGNETHLITGVTNQQDTNPAAIVTTPADLTMSPQTTKLLHKETLWDSKKPETLTNSLEIESTTTSGIIEKTNASIVPTKSINIPLSTASKRSTVEGDTTKLPTESPNPLKITTLEPTSVTEEDALLPTTLPTESATEEEATTGQALEDPTTEIIPEPKTNSSRKILKNGPYSTDGLVTSVPSQKDTDSPTTKSSVSQSVGLPQTSPKVLSTNNGPETTKIPEKISTNTVTKKLGINDTLDPTEEVSSGATSVSNAVSTESLDTHTDVTTDVPSTVQPDDAASSPSTIKLSTDDTGTKNRSYTVSSSNTASPKTDAASPTKAIPLVEVSTPSTTKTDTLSSVTDAPSTTDLSANISISPSPNTGDSSGVTENPDVQDSGFGQGPSTATPLNTREQNIEVVVPTVRSTTPRSHLRSKTKKSEKTGKQAACVDRLKECASYVKENINYCKYHVHFMHEYCSKSCGFCGQEANSIPKCEDQRKGKCQYFSRYVGYCTINREYMRKRCPKSCGFCAVAPGSEPLDKTFVRSDQKYEFSIMTKWDGTPITHAPIKIKLSAEDNTNVRLEVSGPLFNQPGPPPCVAGQPCWQLWNYEVAEVFFLGKKEKYLELEVSPHGPHLLLLLDGVRKPFKTKLPMRYSATKDLSSMTWNGTAIVPMDYFPPGMRKINAYAIHGPDTNKIYESLYPATKTAYPDFHRLEFFKNFDFKSMFPSGWNQPISPLWIRTK